MNINIKDDRKGITIFVSGECPKQEIDKIPKIILEAYNETQNKKILLDTTQVTERIINKLVQFDCGKNLAKLLNRHGIILGIYGNNEIYTDITERVAINMGANIKVSSDYEELLAWLGD